MKIPATFKAVNRLWIVKRMGAKRAAKLNALCSYTKHTIYLADQEDRADMEHSFIHECLHVLEHTLGVKLDHDQLDAAAGIVHQMIESAEGEYNGKV
jgi:hypothetical protein